MCLKMSFVVLPLGWCGTLRVFRNIQATWPEARSLCQSVGMDLVTCIIDDSTKMARVDSCVTENGG